MTDPTTGLPVVQTCDKDTDCKDAYFIGGCCMMVDPGTTSPDLLKLAGLPSSKSKFCASAAYK